MSIFFLLFSSRGRQNKIDRPPRTFAKSQTHPPTIHFFFLDFLFKYVFGRFSARGVQKHHTNSFTKSPCRKQIKKIATKISMSVFPRLFLFYRVFGCFSAMGVKTLQKTFYTKNRVEKFLQKVRPKTQNRLFLEFCFSRAWAFLDEGTSKTR
jgi:hypothetical protein